MTSPEWSRHHGDPFPLGATWSPDGTSCNFAIYSKHADRVTLLLYQDGEPSAPVSTHEFAPPEHKSCRIWHLRLPSERLDGARHYAYRISGPSPAGRFEDHAFDSDKILLDPYAREIHFPPRFSRDAARRPGSNAGQAALAVLPHPEGVATRLDAARPRRDSDLFIYELHVRGLHPVAELGR